MALHNNGNKEYGRTNRTDPVKLNDGFPRELAPHFKDKSMKNDK